MSSSSFYFRKPLKIAENAIQSIPAMSESIDRMNSAIDVIPNTLSP